jgi:hypothetical protein
MHVPVLNRAGVGLGVLPLVGRSLADCRDPNRASWLPDWIQTPSEIACMWGAYPELGAHPYTAVPTITQPVSAAGHAPESTLTAPYVPSAEDLLAAQQAAAAENIAQQNAAIDAAKKAAADSGDGTTGCGFLCELQKYGTGAIVGGIVVAGVLLFVILKK